MTEKNELIVSGSGRDYIENMSDTSFSENFSLPCTECFGTLRTLRWGGYSFLIKLFWIRSWFGKLLNTGYLKKCELTFKKKLKRIACMNDAGKVWFSYGLIFARYDSVVRYVMHETAHLWLSERDNYSLLLKNDKEFFSLVGKTEETLCLSPTERYATTLAVMMMEKAEKTCKSERMKKKLRSQLLREKEKTEKHP